eukprot:TRINITY_DN13269_c0_g1_i1.p1 TRINITY_DN13269_c0_g1~~TRINITY_DN13269_c0_g1_i1.p1  ORF type:complete len:163 (+),score=27.37 TRINITY_DN13269_c0_g1_i1:200-688(+)
MRNFFGWCEVGGANEMNEVNEPSKEDEKDEQTNRGSNGLIERMPHHNDVLSWQRVCCGSFHRDPEVPTLELMQKVDTVTTLALIGHHVEWIEGDDVRLENTVWLYHLLLKLEEPIVRGTVADLRQLRWKCSSKRSKLKCPSDELLGPLNSLLIIITRFFNIK